MCFEIVIENFAVLKHEQCMVEASALCKLSPSALFALAGRVEKARAYLAPRRRRTAFTRVNLVASYPVSRT